MCVGGGQVGKCVCVAAQWESPVRKCMRVYVHTRFHACLRHHHQFVILIIVVIIILIIHRCARIPFLPQSKDGVES